MKGHPVTVFLSVDAPVFATKDLAADVRFADFPSVSEMIRDVIAKGAHPNLRGGEPFPQVRHIPKP